MTTPFDSLVTDLSNYDFDSFSAKAFYAAGVRRAIVGSQQPSLSGQMVDALRSEGIEIIGSYDLPYFGSDDTTQPQAERLATFCQQYRIPMAWTDAEIDANQTNVPQWKDIPTPSVAQRQDEFRRFVARVKGVVQTVGVYTNGAWWNPHMGSSTEWSELPLWLATYGVNGAPTAPIPEVAFGGWTKPTMHQYTSAYVINGRGRDMSYLFEGTAEEEQVTQEEFNAMLAASPLAQQVAELNAALVQRLNLIRVAAGTDEQGYANEQAAYAAVKEKGYVP